MIKCLIIEIPTKEFFEYDLWGKHYKVWNGRWPFCGFTKGTDGWFLRLHRWYIGLRKK